MRKVRAFYIWPAFPFMKLDITNQVLCKCLRITPLSKVSAFLSRRGNICANSNAVKLFRRQTHQVENDRCAKISYEKHIKNIVQ